MSGFGSHTREELRRAYADAWRKQLAGSVLNPVEAMLADVIALHPEYQIILADADTALAFEPDATQAAENPFLHMGLHMAVREQLSIDRPPGVLELHRRLLALEGDAHRAEHLLMEALAETLWQAQRSGALPDELRYLALARSRLGGS